MFCNNCGKEISDKALFCTYCGAKTDNSVRAAGRKSNLGDSRGAYIMIGSVISAIVAVSFLVCACIMAGDNNSMFEWFDGSGKAAGYILHWGICILVIAQSTIFIYLLRKKTNILLCVKFGILLAIEGIVFKILEAVFDNDNFLRDEISVVLYRIFDKTYNNVAWLAIIMGVLLFISGILMQRKTNG